MLAEFKFLTDLAPELVEFLIKRYRILRKIYYDQPIGRRSLASFLGMSERVLRRELEVLREQGLISVHSGGMNLTEEGTRIITEIPPFMRHLLGLTELEERLCNLLKVKSVVVVPGDLEEEEVVKMEIGRAAAHLLKELLKPNVTLAVSGGTTCAAVAEMLPSFHAPPGLTVVPARGGLGEEMDYQANTIAARVARKLKGQYRLLYLPDSLAEESLQVILQEPKVQEILQIINRSDFLLHGIGTVEEMARRRGSSESEIRDLKKRGAVGEVFGIYFDSSGRVVDQVPSVGLYLEDLGERVETVIVVAGGRGKARAIMAVVGNHPRDILVTDEGAAREIVALTEGLGNCRSMDKSVDKEDRL